MRPAAWLAVALSAPFIALALLILAGAGFSGDPHAVVREASERIWEVADRRGPVVGISALAWLAAFGAAMAAGRERYGRPAARLLALTLAYMPLLLMLAAALEPSVGAERLLLMLGGPALAALTLAALGGHRALAVACLGTALAVVADLAAGSPLTQLSLAGPNPAAGHRFYGIGNELEAILGTLILVGTGAALTGFAPRLDRGAAAASFLAVAAALSLAFAYGRFGADVGAAIMLPCGAAVAAALRLDRPRLALAALAVPIPALAILAAIDLLAGANAHLTQTVLQAESGGDVLAVLGRRLGEAGASFGRPLLLAGLPFVLIGALAAWRGRAAIAAWLRPRPSMRAGLAGGLAATLIGTLANDSGALLLELGAAYLGAFCAFAWAESGAAGEAREEPPLAAGAPRPGAAAAPR